MSGKSAPRESLGLLLRHAASSDLLELVTLHGRAIGLREVRQILLNPYVTPAVIDDLLMNRRLLAIYEVRSALVRHRRTPPTAALRFVSGLFWNDLLAIAADMRLATPVRRVAEKYLARRLGKLTVGERITVAHRATPSVIEQLREETNLLVVRALLENPRLREVVLLPVVSDTSTSPEILDLIARHHRWGQRYAIRVALCRNPLAPFRVIFELLPALRRRDVATIADLESHSSIVRHRAREVLAPGL